MTTKTKEKPKKKEQSAADKFKAIIQVFADSYDTIPHDILQTHKLNLKTILDFEIIHGSPEKLVLERYADSLMESPVTDPDEPRVDKGRKILKTYHWLDGIAYAKTIDPEMSFDMDLRHHSHGVTYNCIMTLNGATRTNSGSCAWNAPDLGDFDPHDVAYAKAVKRTLALFGIFEHLYRVEKDYDSIYDTLKASTIQYWQLAWYIKNKKITNTGRLRTIVNLIRSNNVSYSDYMNTCLFGVPISERLPLVR